MLPELKITPAFCTVTASGRDHSVSFRAQQRDPFPYPHVRLEKRKKKSPSTSTFSSTLALHRNQFGELTGFTSERYLLQTDRSRRERAGWWALPCSCLWRALILFQHTFLTFIWFHYRIRHRQKHCVYTRFQGYRQRAAQ